MISRWPLLDPITVMWEKNRAYSDSVKIALTLGHLKETFFLPNFLDIFGDKYVLSHCSYKKLDGPSSFRMYYFLHEAKLGMYDNMKHKTLKTCEFHFCFALYPSLLLCVLRSDCFMVDPVVLPLCQCKVHNVI